MEFLNKICCNILKCLEINERPRSKTPEGDSTDSDSENNYEEARYNQFTEFLKKNLKKNNNPDIQRKSNKSVEKYLS